MSKTSRRSFLSFLGVAAASPVLAKMAEPALPKGNIVYRSIADIQSIRDVNVLHTLKDQPCSILPGRITYVSVISAGRGYTEQPTPSVSPL